MKNSGASFGIDFWGLNIVSIVVLIVIFLIWKKDRNNGWLLIILGGMLNLTERIIFGYVHDYWRIPLTNIYNNFNDYLIFIGGIVVIWDKWKKSK
jgi:lipoprotein signal peptidase